MEELVIVTIITVIKMTYWWNNIEKEKKDNKKNQTDLTWFTNWLGKHGQK